MNENKKYIKQGVIILIMILLAFMLSTKVSATSGDVAGAIEATWNDASQQIRAVVDKVIFPVVDFILVIAFFLKMGLAYFDYRKSGMFEWTAPAILFACLVFTLTAPMYIWDIIA